MYWNHSNQTICSVNEFTMVLSARRLEAHTVITTMETLPAFPRSRDFPKDCFFKDGLAKYDVSAG